MVHVAVIGAGPSGVFAAAELLKRPDVSVDVFDKLPTPFGLVRYGVAPDHHKIKSVTRVLSKVLADPQVRFSGNTEYRRDITADDLRAAYDGVLVATGAPLARKLGVPGEELPGNYAAADLVSWYNGHPQARAAFDTPRRGRRRRRGGQREPRRCQGPAQGRQRTRRHRRARGGPRHPGPQPAA